MMRTICHANKFVKEASATAVPRCSTIYVSIIMATKNQFCQTSYHENETASILPVSLHITR